MTSKEILELRSQKYNAAKAIYDKAESENRDMTEDEAKQHDGLLAEFDALDRRLKRSKKQEAIVASADAASPVHDGPTTDPFASERPREPARARRYQPLNFLKNLRIETDINKRQDLAFSAGRWMQACMGNARAQQWCAQNGLLLRMDDEVRGQTEKTLTAGGFFVPDQIDNAMIDLKEQRGVFRQYARSAPMTSDKKVRMRRLGGLTAYFTAEAGAITESTASWDRVVLVAKDLGTVSLISNDLNEDATISIGDTLIGEIAYAFADKEDECGFNGDGTSTYGGIVGVRAALKNLSATVTNIAGLQVATGNAYTEVAIGDFEGVVGKLPQYADTSNARWFMHRTFYYGTCMRVALASGGVTKEELIQGQRTPIFMGYPVVFSQVMPKVEGNSQVVALLGDLSLAADFGDRRQTSILFSEHATVGSVSSFETNQIAVRGVERFDINVHDVGNQTATAASQLPGPIVGLIMAAS